MTIQEHKIFSIIIPLYNAENTILSTLESCQNQHFTDWEILIIDDSSSDNSVSLVQDYLVLHPELQIHLIQNSKNMGPSYTRNIGWENAKGDYIAFLDADDQWHPDKLMILHSFITTCPEATLLFHSFTLSYDSFTMEISPSTYQVHTISQLSILLRNPIATPCCCCKRSITERFDESLRYAEDHDLWVRIAARYSILELMGPPLSVLGRPMLSKGGISAARHQMRLGEMAMYRKFSNTTKVSWLVFSVLLLFSFLKHLKSELKRWLFRV
ncbi:MAG: glycosyltransferase family A protein [Sulfuricurvum sp.]|nr:glycosyltransferase family A protein [Sulfuricurvum sp.]MDD5385936.1 glycosyltransferase family A protein [Sulfuricurvum sp.]